MATTDGGVHWRKLSPDLGSRLTTRRQRAAGPRPPGGVIESISPSTVASGTIWVGTNNGLDQADAGRGQDVDRCVDPRICRRRDARSSRTSTRRITTPARRTSAVDLHNPGDYAPYLYRTRDFGKTWTRIVTDLPTGQPSGSFARVIRADTKRAGLLFAGTESGMFVSFDDGDHWQSLSGSA